MPYKALKCRLDAGEIVLLDGGTGTELQLRGAQMDPAAWCGPATLENESLLVEIHRDYIGAGAQVITANTFASSRLMLNGAGFGDRVEEINRRAVEAALQAREISPDVVVAGSLSHMAPVGGGTDVIDLALLPSADAISDAFHELAGVLKASGCEMIILEMMYNPTRIQAALEAVLATGLPIWFGFSARRAIDGTVISFDQHEEIALSDVVATIPASGIDAAGPMHTGSDMISSALAETKRGFDGALMAYPDSGHFEMPDWQFEEKMTAERYQRYCSEWLSAGAQIIGGCCGLTIEHIKAAGRARDAVSRS